MDNAWQQGVADLFADLVDRGATWSPSLAIRVWTGSAADPTDVFRESAGPTTGTPQTFSAEISWHGPRLLGRDAGVAAERRGTALLSSQQAGLSLDDLAEKFALFNRSGTTDHRAELLIDGRAVAVDEVVRVRSSETVVVRFHSAEQGS